jgi:protein SMG7
MISRFFDKQCLICRKFLTQVPLLILQNRSSSLQYVSGEVCFDLFKRSGRIGEEKKAQLKDDCANYIKVEGGSNHFTDSKLWSLMVRMISFLFITSRYMSSFHFVLEFPWNFVIYVF